MTPKIPVILAHENTVPAFSIFNPNDWNGKSKPVILSCAAHYGLLIHTSKMINNVFEQASTLCSPSLNNLMTQWKTSKWDISKSSYLVDIPDLHLSIHAFLSSVKTLLDVIVQLIGTEGIVSGEVHGFHKKGDDAGGKLLLMLENNATKAMKEKAALLHNLITEHKTSWIDNAVKSRDFFIHPEKGLSQVMFGLVLSEEEGDLKLVKILKPSFGDEEFDNYAKKMLLQIEMFCKLFIKQVKDA